MDKKIADKNIKTTTIRGSSAYSSSLLKKWASSSAAAVRLPPLPSSSSTVPVERKQSIDYRAMQQQITELTAKLAECARQKEMFPASSVDLDLVEKSYKEELTKLVREAGANWTNRHNQASICRVQDIVADDLSVTAMTNTLPSLSGHETSV